METCRLLLQEKDLDPNCQDQNGRTALSYAADEGYNELVSLMLEEPRIDPNIKDNEGKSPVWWSIEWAKAAWGNGSQYVNRLMHRKNDEVAERLLLDSRTDPNFMEDWTPLWWAAKNDKEAITKRLMAHEGIKPDAKDEAGRTAMAIAAEWGCHKVTEVLLADDRVDPNSTDMKGLSPLFKAVKETKNSFRKENCYTLIKMLLNDPRVRLDGTGQGEDQVEPLIWAAQQEDEEFFMLMLARNQINVNDVDIGNRSALFHAAYHNREEIAKVLLTNHASDLEIDVKDDWNGQTPLLKAAEWGYVGIMKLLLDSGKADKNVHDNYKKTALIYAANSGREEAVALLLNTGGIEYNAADDDGKTALSYAAAGAHEGTVSLLLGVDEIDRNSRDKKGRTPLSHAAGSWKGEKVIRLFLEAEGIEVNSKDNKGRTSLSYAAEWGHEETVQLLLADPRIDRESKDDEGLTALDHAKKQREWAVVKSFDAAIRAGDDGNAADDGSIDSDVVEDEEEEEEEVDGGERGEEPESSDDEREWFHKKKSHISVSLTES